MYKPTPGGLLFVPDDFTISWAIFLSHLCMDCVAWWIVILLIGSHFYERLFGEHPSLNMYDMVVFL